MDAQQTGPIYPVAPLRKGEISVAAIQSFVRTVDSSNPGPGIKANLDHMLWLIDGAQGFGRKHDLLVFHELPLSGWSLEWERRDCLRIATEVPGPETEVLGQKAREHNCYIAFGCYGREADWPGHFIDMGIIVGPSGQIVHKHWKSRNMAGFGFATSVYDVLDAFVERYGWDEVFPVARLDIGNIATMPEMNEPEMARVYAMKGAEIMIRHMTAGGGVDSYRMDLQVQCQNSGIYGIMVNQAVSYENVFYEDINAGSSCIIDNQGKIVARTPSHHEALAVATIPIASFRQKRSLPIICKDLILRAYTEYNPKYPPNSFQGLSPEELPRTFFGGATHFKKIEQW